MTILILRLNHTVMFHAHIKEKETFFCIISVSKYKPNPRNGTVLHQKFVHLFALSLRNNILMISVIFLILEESINL